LSKWKVTTSLDRIEFVKSDFAYVDDDGNLRFYNAGEKNTVAQYAPKFWANFRLDVSENG
jgi:hypothetical protein